MKYKIYLAFVFSIVILHGQEKLHTPWKLDGAKERIENIRKGDSQLHFIMPGGELINEEIKFSLKQTKHAFHFGGSLAADWDAPKQEWYSEFKAMFANLFNYATIDFYWSVHAKVPGEWNYKAECREKLDWAKSQGMHLRGHPLMWHEAIPSWIASKEKPLEVLDQEIMEHVGMLVQKYPEIDEWDMYNETPGIRLKDPEMGPRRWVEAQGDLGQATSKILDAALEIRPKGHFMLNHFQGNDPEYHQQIEYCLDNNVSIDAIGIQTHMHTKDSVYSKERLWDMLEKYSEYNKPIHLSEISVLSSDVLSGWQELDAWGEATAAARKAGKPLPAKPSTAEWEQYQADYTRDFYTLAFSHASVDAIVWWTITDLSPWRSMPAGLIDKNGKPKPVYHALDQLINKDWKTELKGNTKKDGSIQFKGFYGKYIITVQYKGQNYIGQFDLESNQNEKKMVKLEPLANF